jgi:hypothetical protein
MESKTFKSFTLPLLRTAVLLCLLWGQAAQAFASGPRGEFTKTINREFATSADGTTALYNKYGKVNVNTWANNSVKIDITIVVNANSQRDADKTFERIQVNFANSWGYVKAETMIAAQSGWWVEDNTCRDYKINYEVWMPAGNQLDLKNKYGNAWVGALNGKLLAEIRYGDLRTDAINNDADVNMGYGKANLARVKNLYGQVSYGVLSVAEAIDIQLDSKYSETKVEKANNLRITSKYDDFQFGNINELRLQTKYANLRIQNVGAAYLTAQYTDANLAVVRETLDADLTYGNLTITGLGRSFSDVNIIGRYTGVTVGVERGAALRFDAEASYANVTVPSAATIRSRVENGQRNAKQGYLGGEASAKGLVKARLSYGDFVLK